jgi:hypothetical protein
MRVVKLEFFYWGVDRGAWCWGLTGRSWAWWHLHLGCFSIRKGGKAPILRLEVRS